MACGGDADGWTESSLPHPSVDWAGGERMTLWPSRREVPDSTVPPNKTKRCHTCTRTGTIVTIEWFAVHGLMALLRPLAKCDLGLEPVRRLRGDSGGR